MSLKPSARPIPIRRNKAQNTVGKGRENSHALRVLSGAAFAGIAVGIGNVSVGDDSLSAVASSFASVSGLGESDGVQPRVAYYRRCADARAAGVAPLRVGEPGYRSGLDRDGDGTACEPYQGR